MHLQTFPEKIKSYRLESSAFLINWELIKANNILFSKCTHAGAILSPSHIKEKHQTEVNLNMIELLKAGKEIQKELGCSTTPKERKQRIYEKIAHITTKHLKIKNTLMAMKHEAKLQKTSEEEEEPRRFNQPCRQCAETTALIESWRNIKKKDGGHGRADKVQSRPSGRKATHVHKSICLLR